APATVFRDGQLVQPALDGAPAVEALDDSGTTLWRTRLGASGEDLTPAIVRADGVVMVGTRSGDAVALDPATGAEIGRTPLGQALSLAPASLPDGATVFVS